MSLLDKMAEKIGLVDEEYDDELDDDVQDQQAVKASDQMDPGQEANSSIPPEFLQHLQMKEIQPKVPEERPRGSVLPRDVSISLRTAEKENREELSPVDALTKAQVVIKNPDSFDDSQVIANLLRDNQAVIINFEHTDPVLTKRITDFVCGVVYAVGGTVKTISRFTLFCAPRSVDVKNERDLR